MSWAYSSAGSGQFVDYTGATHASINVASLNIPAGSLVVVFAGYDNAGGDKTPTVSDGTRTWTRQASIVETGGNQRSESYYYYNHPGGGSVTITLTPSSGTVAYSSLWVATYTGILTSAALDVSANNAQVTPGTGTDAVTTTNMTTTVANDLLVTFVQATNAATVSAGTSMTSRLTASQFIVEDRNIASATTVAGTATLSAGSGTGAIGMAFKQASAGASLSAPTPSGTIGTQTTATIGATTNQNTGTFYAVVDSAANLSGVTATQIKAGQKASGAAALASSNSAISTTSVSTGVTGLTANTLYSYAAVQNNGNGDSNVVTGTFTTAVATFSTTIPIVDGTGAAYASTSFDWQIQNAFAGSIVASGTTSTDGSGNLAITGIGSSGSKVVTGKATSNALIVFGPVAATFA